MKLTVRRNKNSQYYFPREAAGVAGDEAELIPNTHALIMFPKGSSPRRVLRSLAVIQLDLENQIVAEEEEAALRSSEPKPKPRPRTPKSKTGLSFDELRRKLRGSNR